MSYSVVKSFERGLDTRRMIDTTEGGSLLDAKNCHVTRGGEVEKRQKFAVLKTLPAGTIGLHVKPGGEMHVWGDGASAPAGMPAGVLYHQAANPNGSALTQILAVEEFQDKLYVIGLYADGTRIHWFDGGVLYPPIIVGNTGGGGSGSEPTVGPSPGNPSFEMVLTTDEASTEHSISMAYTESTIYTPYPADPNPVPIPNFRFALIEPDLNFDPTRLWKWPEGWPWHFPEYDMVNKDPAAWATKLADMINGFVYPYPAAWGPSPKFKAIATGAKLVVWADEKSTRLNGCGVSFFTSGVKCTPDMPLFSGGQEASPPGSRRGGPAPVPAPSPRDTGPLVPIDPGTFVLAHDSRMYAVSDHLLNFSKLEDATRWDEAVNGGDIDMTMVAEGTPELVSLADFTDGLAVFARRHILIWRTDELPSLFFKKQVLHRTGLVAPHARVPFGEGEVMYLDRSGIRSLRTRSGVDQAFASDIGVLIDDLVRAEVIKRSPYERDTHFWCEVEPRSGRLWMALWDKIFVLSYFPTGNTNGGGVAAWTWYDATEAPVDMMNATDEALYWRSGDKIICYGGDPLLDPGVVTDHYDATEAMIRVPYVDASKPATFKNWSAIDAAAYGTWEVKASFDPTQPDALDLIANITRSTYAQQKIAMNGESPAVSLVLRTTFVGPAKVGNLTVHYESSVAD